MIIMKDINRHTVRQAVLKEVCKMSKIELSNKIDELLLKIIKQPEDEELKLKAKFFAEYALRR